MPSMPSTSPDATPPTPTYLERMARADGCPQCVTNIEPPRSVIPQETGFTASYHCTSCGHYWLTNWADGGI